MDNKQVEKPWGSYEVLEDSGDYWIKKLYIKEGEKLSLQKHKHRMEVWVVMSGKMKAIKGDKAIELGPGDSITIEKQQKHRLIGVEDGWVLEAALGNVQEGDIIRFEDEYGREE